MTINKNIFNTIIISIKINIKCHNYYYYTEMMCLKDGEKIETATVLFVSKQYPPSEPVLTEKFLE